MKKSRKRRKIELNLKKQSQFAVGRNGRKYLYERILWRFSRFGSAKKQSQFKANQTQLYLAPRFSGGWKTNLKKQSQSPGSYVTRSNATTSWSKIDPGARRDGLRHAAVNVQPWRAILGYRPVKRGCAASERGIERLVRCMGRGTPRDASDYDLTKNW